jgi:hypothetical protein
MSTSDLTAMLRLVDRHNCRIEITKLMVEHKGDHLGPGRTEDMGVRITLYTPEGESIAEIVTGDGELQSDAALFFAETIGDWNACQRMKETLGRGI